MDNQLRIQKITPEMEAALPAEVRAAVAEAREYLTTRYAGRRHLPKPILLTLPLDEEDNLPSVWLPPSWAQLQVLEAATKRAQAAGDLGPLFDTVVVECCRWVQGQTTEPGKDPRVAARDYLKSLLDVPGPAGMARALLAGAFVQYCNTVPEVTAGKL